MLIIDDLHFSFNGSTLIDGFELKVDRGAVCAILGESGCGKSTLLKNLMVLLKPSKGSIQYPGQNETTLKFPDDASLDEAVFRDVRRNIGYVPQTNILLPHLSALENAPFGLVFAHGMSKRIAQERAFQSLQRVGLETQKHMHPWELSGGQQQRVAIARAMVGAPPLLLMDEPTSALDETNARIIGEWITEEATQRGMSVLVVTHNMAFVRQYCRTAIIMSNGRVVRHLRSEELKIDDLKLGFN